MANLNKYKRSNINIFEDNRVEAAQPTVIAKTEEAKQVSNANVKTDNRGRKAKEKPLNVKFTMNFSEDEADILYKINEETGIPISTLLRKKLKESGIFN